MSSELLPMATLMPEAVKRAHALGQEKEQVFAQMRLCFERGDKIPPEVDRRFIELRHQIEKLYGS